MPMQNRDRVTTSEGSSHVIILSGGSMFSLEVCYYPFFLLDPRNGWCPFYMYVNSLTANQFHTTLSLSLYIFSG